MLTRGPIQIELICQGIPGLKRVCQWARGPTPSAASPRTNGKQKTRKCTACDAETKKHDANKVKYESNTAQDRDARVRAGR